MWERRSGSRRRIQIKKLETFASSLTAQWESGVLLRDYGASLSKGGTMCCGKAAVTDGDGVSLSRRSHVVGFEHERSSALKMFQIDVNVIFLFDS